jgi:hypothetical protein
MSRLCPARVSNLALAKINGAVESKGIYSRSREKTVDSRQRATKCRQPKTDGR